MRVQSVRIRDANIVKLLGQEVPKKDIFEYLGSIMHKGEYVDEDVNYEIRVVQMKWCGTSRVLCDCKIPAKLKGKFYRMKVRQINVGQMG